MPPFFSLPHIEDCSKRIRAYAAGVCLIDTKKAKLVYVTRGASGKLQALTFTNVDFTVYSQVRPRAPTYCAVLGSHDHNPIWVHRWLHESYPSYFVERADLPISWYMVKVDETESEMTFTITVGQRTERLSRSVVLFLTGPLQNLAFVKFDAMDAWFEEDEEIFIHPKDPYKRIDILQSSRHVRIEVNGIEIANTRTPRLLFETNLPVRTYIPKTDCRMDLWEPSMTKTGCPYKGTASYYNVVLASGEVFEDIVWWYPNTTAEATSIRGFVAFFDEKVDVWVDGEKKEHPQCT